MWFSFFPFVGSFLPFWTAFLISKSRLFRLLLFSSSNKHHHSLFHPPFPGSSKQPREVFFLSGHPQQAAAKRNVSTAEEIPGIWDSILPPMLRYLGLAGLWGLCLDTLKHTLWIYPPPSSSRTWRFIGIPYKKCNNRGGDCYWVGGRPNTHYSWECFGKGDGWVSSWKLFHNIALPGPWPDISFRGVVAFRVLVGHKLLPKGSAEISNEICGRWNPKRNGKKVTIFRQQLI